MKYPKPHVFRSLPPLWAAPFLFSLSSAHADLVGTWIAGSFDPATSPNWTSEEGIVATPAGIGSPTVLPGELNGQDALDFFGDAYFVVPAAGNPVASATALTLAAVFEPATGGNSGTHWWQSTGLIGMEQANDTADWGFGWNGGRLAGGVGGPDTTVFSGTRDANTPYVGIFTWNNGGQMRLFLNGVEVATNLSSPTGTRNTGAFALAAITGGASGNNPFNGRIAELRIYNSDETAQAAAITAELMEKYIEGVTLQSFKMSRTGGTFTIQDAAGKTDAAAQFVVSVNMEDLPPQAVQISKTGSTTTVTFQADYVPDMLNLIELTVPLEGGGTRQLIADARSYLVPENLGGAEGSVGTWAIREYRTTAAPVENLRAAIDIATGVTPDIEYVDGTAPVFNHSDPETNGARTMGNFNNDLPIISNTGPGELNPTGNDAWVVVGKTQVSVPAPGTYTFSVHSDDGFALRVSGSGGGRFVAVHGSGGIDAGDDQTVYLDAGTGDSNTRGVYQFDAAGIYVIDYLGWDGQASGFYELAWAPGAFTADRDSNTWQLVGNPADPIVTAIPYKPRFIPNPPGPTGTEGSFGVRTFLAAGSGVGSVEAASDFLMATTRQPGDPDGLTVDAQLPFLNHRDPQNGGGGVFPGELPFPGNSSADEDRVVTVAKGRISIPVSGPYTFWIQGDDGALLRIKGVGGNPNPPFSRATQGGNSADGRFEMSNPNELFYNGGGNPNTRGIINLNAGQYDIEFVHYEGAGGFHYELTAALGSWPHGTTPENGFHLVGFTPPASSVSVPRIAAPGWTVRSSTPNRQEFQFNIVGAEAAINATLALQPPPENAISTWNAINFRDPENGPEGPHAPSNPWPLNTPADDNNYAMRANGRLIVTEAADYYLGFQGDDGGYMYIDGVNGTPTPSWHSIAVTNFPNDAKIEPRVAGSGVNNAIRLQVGTGNSRTIGKIHLVPGEYEIQTLVYEGGGGSWWEVVGAKGNLEPSFFNYPLLETGESEGTIFIGAGLTLVNQAIAPPPADFRVTNFAIVGTNPVTSANLSFPSTPGQTYTIQASTDLVTWVDIGQNIPANASGSTTTYNANLAGTQFEGEERVFFRVAVN